MSWTEKQCGQILAAFWENGGPRTKIAHCPTDGAQLDLRFIELHNGYVLMARCPACDSEEDLGRELDPKRDQFREWTDEERKLVEQAYLGTGQRCPVCGMPIDVDFTSNDSGEEQYLLRCIRCKNSHTKARGSSGRAEERRRHPRTPLRQLVQVGREHGLMGSTADVSRGGLRFEAQEAFDVGSDIALSFAVGERIIEATAQVVHFESGGDGAVSMGVRFTNLSPVDQSFIEKYCRTRDDLA